MRGSRLAPTQLTLPKIHLKERGSRCCNALRDLRAESDLGATADARMNIAIEANANRTSAVVASFGDHRALSYVRAGSGVNEDG